MKPAKNPVADQIAVSTGSGVPGGRVEPTMKQAPVLMPPKAVTVLRTPARSESQPERNTLQVKTIQK